MISNAFLISLRCEWLKTQRTAAIRLAILGATLIPTIMVIAQLWFRDKMSYNANPDVFWVKLYLHNWEFMSVLLLPFGIILITSMLTQIEFRNNTWKQTLITPQSLTTIFISKFVVISILLLLFFVAFNCAIILSGIVPGLVHSEIDVPRVWPPFSKMLGDMGALWLTSLPLLGLMYAISLRFSNFIVPIGIGLAGIVAGIFALQWKEGYVVPFAYSTFHFMTMSGQEKFKFPFSIYHLSLIWFVIFVSLGYLSFRYRKYKA